MRQAVKLGILDAAAILLECGEAADKQDAATPRVEGEAQDAAFVRFFIQNLRDAS